MKIRVFILFALFLFLPTIRSLGQIRDIYVQVFLLKNANTGEKTPLSGVYVCGFWDDAEAAKFAKYVTDNISSITVEDIQTRCDKDLSYKQTGSNGRVTLTMPLRRHIVCISIEQETVLNYFCTDDEPKIVLKSSIGRLGEAFGTGHKEYTIEPVTRQNGRWLRRDTTAHIIDAEYARGNARYVLAPIFICCEDTTDTLCRIAPFIKHGEQFDITQIRRKAFSMEKYDSLIKRGILDREDFMKSHEQSLLLYNWNVLKPDDRHYRVLADMWCEDYNGEFYRDTATIDYGLTQDPFRFLDFKLDDIPIDKKRYLIEGKPQQRDIKKNLRFQYEQGRAELVEDDSINKIEKQRLLKELSRIDASMELQNVQLIGRASPDGPYATNQSLSQRRAQTIAQWLRENSSLVQGKITASAKVATWAEVADLLFEIGDTLRGSEIRQIVNNNKTMTQQEQQIKKLPYYNSYLLTQILPKFRDTEFSLSYYIKKVLDASDIEEKYETNENGYRDRIKEHYEYSAIFDYLEKKGRTQELEEQAKQAFEHLGENEGKRTRPWPLAAYYYANCLLKRKAPNLAQEPSTSILSDLISIRFRPTGEDTVYKKYNEEDGTNEYWNDEAIVTTFAGMYFFGGDPVRASWIVNNCFNPYLDKYENIKLFFTCQTDYDKPEVREAVAATSSYNKVVMYLAQDERRNKEMVKYLIEALKTLRTDPQIDSTDNRIKYLEANLTFRIHQSANKVPYVEPKNFYIESNEVPDSIKYKGKSLQFIKMDKEAEEEDRQLALEARIEKLKEQGVTDIDYVLKYEDRDTHFGIPMVEACEVNPQFLEDIKWDQYFSPEYRKAFFFYWNGKHAGKTNRQIEDEWKALREKEKE